MANQRKRRHRPSRRGGRFFGLYILLSVVLIVAVIASGCIVFFKVNQFEVNGNSKYSAEEIVKAAGVSTGDNLCLVNKTEAAGKVLANLPYVQSVNIRRKLPDTVTINVVETEVVAAINSGNRWWFMNTGGKLLDRAKDSGTYIKITGLPLIAPTVGETITVKTNLKGTRDSLIKLLTAMQARDLLSKVQSVDCGTKAQLVMNYNDQLNVKMLVSSDYDYQVKMLKAVLQEYVDVNWSKSDKGTLDMTYDDGHPHLTKDKQ